MEPMGRLREPGYTTSPEELEGLAIVGFFTLLIVAASYFSGKDTSVKPVEKPAKIERVLEQYDSNRDAVLDRQSIREL